jgi:hypothetical protein
MERSNFASAQDGLLMKIDMYADRTKDDAERPFRHVMLDSFYKSHNTPMNFQPARESPWPGLLKSLLDLIGRCTTGSIGAEAFGRRQNHGLVCKSKTPGYGKMWRIVREVWEK